MTYKPKRAKTLLDLAAIQAKRDVILKALQDHNGNYSATARALNIDRKTIYNLIHT